MSFGVIDDTTPGHDESYEPEDFCEECGSDIGWHVSLCYECWPRCEYCYSRSETVGGGMCKECRENFCSIHQQAFCEDCTPQSATAK